MNKYFVIYRVPTAVMDEWRAKTSPEDIKAQMAEMGTEMGAWMDAHRASFADPGSPLGRTKTVTKDGVADTRNDLNYFCIVEAGSHDEAAKIFLDNPHLKIIPQSSIDVMEIPHMGL